MRVLFAGGGTGGHVYPAIAMISELRRWNPDAEIGYVGTRRGLEARIVPERGDARFFPIHVKGLKHAGPGSTLRTLAWLVIAMIETLVVLIRFRPQIVIGVGGHSSFPPLFLAALIGKVLPVRTLIHEQNVIGGLANRILARFVDSVLISFRESARSFPRARRLVVTGNPIREEMLHEKRTDAAYSLFGLDPERRTILVFGGSGGSDEITEQIRAGRAGIAANPELQILLITGDANRTESLREEMRSAGAANVVVETYVDRMGAAFAVADLVVCRAGATSLAEITACGKASLLVPWRGAADDHQWKNARSFQAEGACTVADEEIIVRHGLVRLMQELADDETRLARLAANARRNGRRDAGFAILKEIRALMREAAV
ncbi:MAG: UDP-N-acetylglucosamine--N-acetylmuramyl-(pentapeptide) pyrophosphoryl-undecaprenol N-acetylglucosamine transferase [Candidatus Bipolaricaulia bacterium]